MGVYITGMEMPKEIEPALVIDFAVDPDGNRYARFYHYRYGGLTDWHEIIEIPEPHGRLIDAEQLKETLDYYIREAGWSDEINKAINWVKDEFINSEPTVIPASERKE